MAQSQEEPSKSKNELQSTITAANIMPEKVINIEPLKEMGEEVQYAIANHESYPESEKQRAMATLRHPSSCVSQRDLQWL